MFRWFIAYKYLASRFITFAALLTVASAVALLIVILSVMEGFRTDLEDRIRGTSSDLRVESRSLVGLKDPRALAARLEALPGVASASPAIESLAIHRRRGEAEYFFLQGFDFTAGGKAASVEAYLENARQRGLRAGRGNYFEISRRGELLARQPRRLADILSKEWLGKRLWEVIREPPPAEIPPPVLLGYEAMENFGLSLGTLLELASYSPVTHRAVSGKFVVAGVLLSRDYVFDSRTLLMPIGVAEDFLEVGAPNPADSTASALLVYLDPGADLDETARTVRAAVVDVPFVRVKTWREEKASLLRAVRIEKTVVGIILGVLIVFAGFMIFIVLTVQVVEKTRDLGILQSLGSTSRGIAGIYLLIGSSVCGVGTLLGTVLGVGFSLSINPIQRWLYLLVGFELFPQDVYYIDRIPVKLAPLDLLYIIVPTVVASALASVVPAYRAARKDPVVALRYE